MIASINALQACHSRTTQFSRQARVWGATRPEKQLCTTQNSSADRGVGEPRASSSRAVDTRGGADPALQCGQGFRLSLHFIAIASTPFSFEDTRADASSPSYFDASSPFKQSQAPMSPVFDGQEHAQLQEDLAVSMTDTNEVISAAQGRYCLRGRQTPGRRHPRTAVFLLR
jgi:hypothetical protein